VSLLRACLLVGGAALAFACQGASAEPATGAARAAPLSSEAAQSVTARFHVEGMACDRCSGRLRDGLRKLDGIVQADADHQKKEVVVSYDPARTTPERIKAEIERYGFEVTG